MTSKQYFSSIAKLLESDPSNIRKLHEAMAQQDPLQDPGLVDQQPAPMPEQLPPPEGDPMMAGMDASYMTPPAPSVEPTIDDITEQEQRTKLFDNFSELSKLISHTYENLTEKIKMDMLDEKQIDVMRFSLSKIKDLIEKIRDYQMDSFVVRKYEENLYMYMLVRSEFLTTIQYIRTALKLHEAVNDNENKNK